MSKKTRKKRGYNTKSLKNLDKGVRFSARNQPANNGRKKKLSNMVKSIPEDAQTKIYETLYAAIRQPNREAAQLIIEEGQDELGEYGLILQIAARNLIGKNDMATLNDILDRIFGKPKQQGEFNLNGKIDGIVVNVRDFSKGEENGEVSQEGKQD